MTEKKNKWPIIWAFFVTFAFLGLVQPLDGRDPFMDCLYAICLTVASGIYWLLDSQKLSTSYAIAMSIASLYVTIPFV